MNLAVFCDWCAPSALAPLPPIEMTERNRVTVAGVYIVLLQCPICQRAMLQVEDK